MADFDLDALRRYPDVEADNLFAVDASDRLILDQAAADVAAAAPGTVAVLGDNYGAITLGATMLHGASAVRTFQDSLVGELALAANAEGLSTVSPATVDFTSLPLGAELLESAKVVLMQLPRGLDELDEWAGAIARHADPSVVVYGGGRLKHMTTTMNDVLRRHFGRLDVSPARQKSRVLIAREPLAAERLADAHYPLREFHDDFGLWLCAYGATFAGTKVDIGTRLLLGVLDRAVPDARDVVDLGCGSGVLAASIAMARPGVAVLATDVSAGAVASARATMTANGLHDRVTVVRDIGLAAQPDASADLVLLNPPFHVGSTVHTGLASRLFRDAARVLRPGGELWTVYNSHLGYRPQLQSVVGETREIARNAKFTVTASRRR